MSTRGGHEHRRDRRTARVLSHVNIRFAAGDGPATVDDVSLSLARGEIVALVGELGRASRWSPHTIAGILTPAARITAEGARLRRRRSLAPKGAAGRIARARDRDRLSGPRAALNPVLTVGRQIGDVIREHRGLSGARLSEAVIVALAAVRIQPSCALAPIRANSPAACASA
jgi:ABC-type microcin C transport system duplicated ATPase subunit YejF